MGLDAPRTFADWLDGHRHQDANGFMYQYHSRSDAHSKELARLIWLDLLTQCPTMRLDHDAGIVRMEVNYRHTWSGTLKSKTIDMAIGTAGTGGGLREVRISCELKAVMTEHQKSQPRVFDELSSSYQIVHRADPEAIAAGVTVVNIAETFVSPLRQRPGGPLVVTRHRQPEVTRRMVQHLRGLRLRGAAGEDGFDAYCTLVVDCDNQARARLWTAPPAPQPGQSDHYASFVAQLCALYAERYA